MKVLKATSQKHLKLHLKDKHITSEIASGCLQQTASTGSSFLSKLGIALGTAAVITLISVGMKQPNQGSSPGMQFLRDGSSSSTLAALAGTFSFKAFGYRILLPEYAPGWIYFWLQVGITLARMLSLDETWQILVDSLSRNAPYILSTIVWVYWVVCINDMIPFYVGKIFRESGVSDDISSEGLAKRKQWTLHAPLKKYGNLIGFVERFSIGVRNPTAFLAGAMLGIGFLLREGPVFALATVATVVGIWTMFPYTMAASTALFLYLRRHYFS